MVNRIIIRSIVWFTWNSKPVWLIFQAFFFFFFLIYCVGGCLHKCRMSLIFYFAFPSRNPESLLQCFENRQQILKVFLRLYLPENTTLNTTFHRVSQSLLILWLKVLFQTEPNSNIRCTFKWANIWWGQKSDIGSRKQRLWCCYRIKQFWPPRPFNQKQKVKSVAVEVKLCWNGVFSQRTRGWAGCTRVHPQLCSGLIMNRCWNIYSHKWLCRLSAAWLRLSVWCMSPLGPVVAFLSGG